jgi:hypothetical protein
MIFSENRHPLFGIMLWPAKIRARGRVANRVTSDETVPRSLLCYTAAAPDG